MDTHEQRLAAYLENARASLTDEQVRALTAVAAQADERVAVMSAEERQTYGDTLDMLSSAVAEKFAPTDDDYAWVCDFTDEWAVFSKNGEKFQVPYTLDGDAIDLGDATPVREVTTYEPLQSNSAEPAAAAPRGLPGANPATAKRSFSTVLERPPAHSVEIAVRMDDQADPNVAHFLGYASTTEQAYGVRDWLGEYDETIRAGAFAKTLRESPDVPMLLNHDPNYLLANTRSGTSRLGEDGAGLRNDADFDRRQTYVSDLCISLQRGDIDKMSFSFRAIKDDWNDTYDQRGVTELQLYDTSVVVYPANPHTTAQLQDEMRSVIGGDGNQRMIALRSALPTLIETRDLTDLAGDTIEAALRALLHADEVMAKRHGPHGRARTFLVARSMMELRAGKVLSGANQQLLQDALTALSTAEASHQTTADAHSSARDSIQAALDSATATNGDGSEGNQGVGSGGDAINPQDGAGPRSANPALLAREREQELRQLRRRA